MENKKQMAVPYLKVLSKQLKQYHKFQCKQHSWRPKGDGLTSSNREYNGEERKALHTKWKISYSFLWTREDKCKRKKKGSPR